MNTSTKSLSVCAVFAGLLLSGIAVADRKEASRLAETGVSLTEAIAIAEKHQGGRAYEAGLEDDNNRLTYEVDVVVGDKVYEVEVDALSGNVGKVKEDSD